MDFADGIVIVLVLSGGGGKSRDSGSGSGRLTVEVMVSRDDSSDYHSITKYKNNNLEQLFKIVSWGKRTESVVAK